MEAVIVSFAMRVITELTKKTWLRPQAIMTVLCVIAWTGYYFLNKTNPETVQQTIEFVWKSFAISQGFYLFLSKKIPQEEKTSK